MSEEAPIWQRENSFMDGDWSVFVSANPLALTFERGVSPWGGKTVVSLPLTAPRAQAIIRLLHDALVEAGEIPGPRIVPVAKGLASMMDHPRDLPGKRPDLSKLRKPE